MATEKQEFIDPNELMRYINENHSYSGLPMAAHILTMELLTYAPRVEIAEVIHGRWLLVAKGGCTSAYECSICRRAVTISSDEDLREKLLMKQYPYCNCGAKMDGERKNK